MDFHAFKVVRIGFRPSTVWLFFQGHLARRPGLADFSEALHLIAGQPRGTWGGGGGGWWWRFFFFFKQLLIDFNEIQ